MTFADKFIPTLLIYTYNTESYSKIGKTILRKMNGFLKENETDRFIIGSFKIWNDTIRVCLKQMLILFNLP